MNEQKTLKFEWEYGVEEVFLFVGAYQNGLGLYIGLRCKKDDLEEDFGDLTINLPIGVSNVKEAYIDHFAEKDKLAFIRKYELGSVLPGYGYSGFCKYVKVTFDLERLAELDPEGTKRFLKLHGISGKEERKEVL